MMSTKLWFIDKIYLKTKRIELKWNIDMFECMDTTNDTYYIVSGDLDIQAKGSSKQSALETFFIEFYTALNYYKGKSYIDLAPNERRLKALYDNIVEKEISLL